MTDIQPEEKGKRVKDEFALLVKDALETRDDRLREEFRTGLLALSEPQRDDVKDILPDTQRDEAPIVSRKQPMDPMYERLYAANPLTRDWRTADLDHYNAQWLRGFIFKDREQKAQAIEKLGEISGLGRAVTTYSIGDLDVSDPTAVLDGSAGDWLPQPLANVVEIARDEVAVLPSRVENLVMTSGTLRVPTADAFNVEMVAEGATSTAAGPAAASVMLKAQKMSGFAKLTIESLADAAFNLISFMSGRAGRAMGALEDTEICTSSGSAPSISAKLVGENVAEATSTVLIYEDLVTLLFALAKVYRTNAIWLANSVTLTLLSTLMDGNSQPILKLPGQQPNVISDAPGAIGTLFGKGVFEVPLADGELIFGDPKGYVFARRQGISIASSTESSFSADIVDLKITQRIDGNMIDVVALKQMSGLATVA